MKKTFTVRDLVLCAMIAAVYTALCMALAPISYGNTQIRVAEALTLLPVISPLFIWGVTAGCALSNFIGFMLGANMLGFLDVFFGTAATLLAAIFSYLFRKVRIFGVPVLSAGPPVVLNAVIIGFELTYMLEGRLIPAVFAINALSVGIGQMISCFAFGLPLVYLMERTGIAPQYFGADVHK